MSPAEARFVRIMGGRVLTVSWLASPINNRFPVSIVLSLGRDLKREKMRREVRVGAMYIDFGNDIRRGIEIDGRRYHRDVLKEHERNKYVAQYGWRLLHIDASEMYRSPEYVRRKVIAFLSD
jgi:very-short-patch-repair endonuclease